MKEYLAIANDPLMWLMVAPAICTVFLQIYLISKRAVKAAHIVEMTGEEAKKAFKTGFISGIGPASSVFIVMLAMIAVVGGPITWLRTVIIGAASTELAAATIGADAMGVEFGGAGYGVTEYANSVLIMVLNGSGWLVFCLLFTDKLGSLQNKVSGGNAALLGAITGAAMVGAMSYLVSGHLLAGGGRLIAAVAAGLGMVLFGKLSDKYPKIGEHILGMALIVGMIAGTIYVYMAGEV